jgi:Kdo2-lipid IVA lauroyltransferase/acyltransferase
MQDAFLSMLLKSLRFVPFFLVPLIGKLIGIIMIFLDKERFNVTTENLKLAYPELGLKQVDTLAKKSYQSLGITTFELLKSIGTSNKVIEGKVDFTDYHVVNKGLRKGKGIVFISGHLGNWEWMTFVAGSKIPIPITLIAKTQRASFVNDCITQFRGRTGNQVVDMNSAARTIFRELSSNNAVAIMIDQAADPTKDVFVEFFNRPAVTYEAPATLALRTGATIIFCACLRNANGTYTVHLEEIDYHDLPDTPEGRALLTQRYTSRLEHYVRLYPEQWSWQHKRWKYNPLDFPNRIIITTDNKEHAH